ncbi:uncharacterized protein LOC26528252 [Drosophila mojavensis]|uniref:Uncharacterized protein n=1 Tax=Drosophila mojavensis TaxID=7230 RepID=A0A0Q9WYX8_DROMO|nr:uncharacterized protein LOC26528252 [Drosophila mojavensis]KRF94233.1 uncharacterized protein Dmoj_GI26611 [Drosophila mojavensis]
MSNYMRPNPISAYKMTKTIDSKLQRGARAEDAIPELDEDEVALVAETFGKVQLYLRSDTNRGYVKLNAPGLYSFRLPEYPDGNPESVTHNENEDARLTDSWTNESMEEINMVKQEDEPLLGCIQRDEVTGEFYILTPLEIDVLLQSDLPADACEQTPELPLVASDSTTTITDLDADVKDASQTTLTDNTQPAMPQESDDADTGILCEYEVCRFVVPQLSLNFKLTLHVGEPDEDDADTHDEEDVKDDDDGNENEDEDDYKDCQEEGDDYDDNGQRNANVKFAPSSVLGSKSMSHISL